METKQITLYAHYRMFDGSVQFFVNHFDNDDHYIFLGEQEVTVNIPDHTPEVIKAQRVKQLEASAASIQAECTSKLEPIIKKVNELRG